MSESQTPRTDAEKYWCYESSWDRSRSDALKEHGHQHSECVSLDFSRQLERELNEAKARLKIATDALIVADKILDDIDTAGDMFKPPISNYFKYVAQKCQEGMPERRKVLAEMGIIYDVSERNQPSCQP